MLLTSALIFGGTGASPFIRLVMPAPQLYSSLRFMGSALTPEERHAAAGQMAGAREPSRRIKIRSTCRSNCFLTHWAWAIFIRR